MGSGAGGGLLGDMEYFVGILKIHKLFLPANSNLIFIALHLLEKKLSLRAASKVNKREYTFRVEHV